MQSLFGTGPEIISLTQAIEQGQVRAYIERQLEGLAEGLPDGLLYRAAPDAPVLWVAPLVAEGPQLCRFCPPRFLYSPSHNLAALALLGLALQGVPHHFLFAENSTPNLNWHYQLVVRLGSPPGIATLDARYPHLRDLVLSWPGIRHVTLTSPGSPPTLVLPLQHLANFYDLEFISRFITRIAKSSDKITKLLS